MKKRKSISIGIPVYNEEENIKLLISDILNQDLEDIFLDNIIISSDGSTDNTCLIVESIKNTKINLFKNTDRKGISRGLNQIIKNSVSDALVILNGDIRITNKDTLHKLTNPIFTNDTDLTSCKIIDPNPKSLLSRALKVSMEIKENIGLSIKKGDHVLTCHGPARAFSRRFYKTLKFPVSIGEDAYSYLACKYQNMSYKYDNTASVFYKLPESFSDHLKQSRRYIQISDLLSKYFPKNFILSQIRIPTSNIYLGIIRSIPEIKKNIIPTLYYCLVLFISKLNFIFDKNESQAWIISKTSKIVKI